jgi:hypothetical protein
MSAIGKESVGVLKLSVYCRTSDRPIIWKMPVINSRGMEQSNWYGHWNDSKGAPRNQVALLSSKLTGEPELSPA